MKPQETNVTANNGLTIPIRITTTYPPGYPDEPTMTDWVAWGQRLHDEILNPRSYLLGDNQLFKKKTELYQIKVLNGKVVKQKTILNLEPPTMSNKSRALPAGIQPYTTDWYVYMAKEIRSVKAKAELLQYEAAALAPNGFTFGMLKIKRTRLLSKLSIIISLLPLGFLLKKIKEQHSTNPHIQK